MQRYFLFYSPLAKINTNYAEDKTDNCKYHNCNVLTLLVICFNDAKVQPFLTIFLSTNEKKTDKL